MDTGQKQSGKEMERKEEENWKGNENEIKQNQDKTKTYIICKYD